MKRILINLCIIILLALPLSFILCGDDDIVPAGTNPPVITISSHSDDDFVSSSFTIEITVSDESGVQSISADVDGTTELSAVDDGSGKYTIEAAGLSDGSHTITITVVNNNNVSQTATLTVIVDTTAPVVEITSPADGSMVTSISEITGTASDTNGISLVEVDTGEGYSSATGTDTWSYSFSPDTNGSYTITARATDNAGNTGTDSITVTIDLPLAVTNIAHSSASDSLTITWSTNELATSNVEVDTDPLFSSPISSATDTTADNTSHSVIVGSLDYDTTYYVRITSEDSGSESVTTDGTYTATTLCGSGVDFVLSNLSVPASVKVGSTMEISFDFRNKGDTDYEWFFGGAEQFTVYFSDDDVIGSDTYVGYLEMEDISACSTISISGCLGISTSFATGTYYLVLHADGNTNIDEIDDANNSIISGSIDASVQGVPDFTVDFDSVSTTSVYQNGNALEVDVEVSNIGDPYYSSTYCKVFLDINGNGSWDSSTDFALTSNTMMISPFLCSGTSQIMNYSKIIPDTVLAGTYDLVAIVDYLGSVDEGASGEANNDATYSTQITILDGDVNLVLTAISITGSTGSLPGTIPVEITIENQGTTPIGASELFVVLSEDLTTDFDDTMEDNIEIRDFNGGSPVLFEIPSLAASGSYTFNGLVDATSYLAAGCIYDDFYIYAEADSDGWSDDFDESDETDNGGWASGTFTLIKTVDVYAHDSSTTETVFSLSGTVTGTISFSITNQGTSDYSSEGAPTLFDVAVMLGPVGGPHDYNSDTYVGYWNGFNFEIDASETIEINDVVIDVSMASAGSYDLYIYLDPNGVACESDYANNYHVISTVTVNP